MVLHVVFEFISTGPWNPFKTSFSSQESLIFKSAIKWAHSKKFKYIVLSPHILPEAKKHIDVVKYNISSIYHPFVYKRDNNPLRNNDFIRFATIGKGSPGKIKSLAEQLNKIITQKVM